MALLDLVSYRDSGELSDVTVIINETELQLHKFPLYIRSEYFKELAKEDRIALDDFPGGVECFNVIADFCYNKRIDISLENVVQLRCGAEYLRMHGHDNLAELTDRYLDDVVNSAQIGRSVAPIVDLLTKAAEMGAAAAESKVAEKCFAAVLDMWSRPSASQGPTADRLLQLPLGTFEHLVKSCADNERQRRPLADVVCRYLSRVFQRDQSEQQQLVPEKESEVEKEKKEEKKEEEAKAEKAEEKEEDEEGEKKEEEAEAEAAEGEKEKEEDEEEKKKEDEEEKAGSDAEADEKPQAKKEKSPESKDKDFEPKEPAGEVLDRVILSLPEQTPLSEVINGDWIRQALQISEKYNCECRSRLLQLAGNILHRFRQEELKQMPSPVLCDIVSSTVDKEGVEPEVLSCVIDNHLLDLAKAGHLTPEDFVKLAKSVPTDYRSSHDTLYEVAEALLTSGEGIPDDQQKEVIEAVDLTRCGESTLQRALDKGAVPAKVVCQAAIDLAKKLRQQQPQESQEKAASAKRVDDLRSKYLTPSAGTGGSRRFETTGRFGSYGQGTGSSAGYYGGSAVLDYRGSRYDDSSSHYDDSHYSTLYTDDHNQRLDYQPRSYGRRF